MDELTLRPIGLVRNTVSGQKYGDWEAIESVLELDADLEDALDGITGFSHILVLTWLNQLGPEDRRRRKVHPRGRQELPLVGVLATHSQYRPNPIGVQVVQLLSRDGTRLRVRGLDAFDGTPVLDVKGHVPQLDAVPEATAPAWVSVMRQKAEDGGARRADCTILGVFAHPDDESFGAAGALSKYADMGVRVVIATATRGEAGLTGEPAVTTVDHLGEVREQELRCACEVIGVSELRLLGFMDGEAERWDTPLLEKKIATLVEEVRPQVVITFGPDGISGHADHIAVSAATTRVCRAPDAGNGLGYGVQRLFYLELPRETRAKMGLALGDSTTAELTQVDVSSQLDRKRRALECHRTQNKDWIRIFADESWRQHWGNEYYRLAAGNPAVTGVPTELIAGLC